MLEPWEPWHSWGWQPGSSPASRPTGWRLLITLSLLRNRCSNAISEAREFGPCRKGFASFDWAACTTVFMKKDQRVQYMGGPVRVMEILDIGQKKDATGLETWVRITDAVVSRHKR